jgi:formylglycine-generating enzyme required for sulfatase activity/thiol-disulfide isomerase/thioredoxin
VRRLSLLLFLSLLLAAPPARAGSGLDVEAWLTKPGVRLLAVEFYATWCKPCMAAVPKWKALHEKYKKDGLRLVVVSVRDPKGGCANLAWTPDDVICDDEGFLADRFGAADLPAAFLWSWQGDVLSHHEHVEAVEAAVERYLAAAPRLDVEVKEVAAKARMKKDELESLLRGRLSESRKVPVVASAAERQKLRELVKRSLAASADEAQQCEAGKELSANSLLVANVSESGNRLRLSLSLQSAERGCQEAYTAVDWDADAPGASVEEAVAEVMQQLRHETQYPWAVAARSQATAPASPLVSPGPAQPRPAPAADDLDAKLQAAQRRETEAREAKEAASRERAARWEKVQAYAALESVPREERLAEVDRFLSGLPADAAERAPAQALAGRLRFEPGVARPGKAGMAWVGSRPAGLEFAKTETTVAQYAACVSAGACTEPDTGRSCNWDKRSERADHPINCVDATQADAFCRWAGGRLPTEDEWYAEASNGGSRTYPWGEEELSCSRAIWGDGSNTDGCGKNSTWPVCSRPSGNSVSETCDLSGNVWEWTSVSNGDDRMSRGGAWFDDGAMYLAARARYGYAPSERRTFIGFRCVLSLE